MPRHAADSGGALPARALLLALVFVVAGCGGTTGTGGNTTATKIDGVPIGLPDVAGGSATGVSLTPETVVVDRTTVAANLRHVSGDGTYTFSSPSGALAALAPGKVMLLQGTDAAHVTSVDKNGGQLVVHTSPVSIPEVIQSGQFHYKGPIDLTNAIAAPVVYSLSPPPTTSSVQLPPSGGSTASPGQSTYRLLSSTPKLTVSGDLGDGWSYDAAIFGDENGLNVEASLKLKRGVLVGSVKITAQLHLGDTTFDMSVANGQVSQGGFSASTLDGKWKVEYAFGQGDAVDGIIDFPVLRIPFSWTIPWTLGGIPMVLKISQALIVKLGLSSKNATVKGGVAYNMTGQGGMVQTGSSASPASGTSGTAHGNVLGAGAGNVSISPAPSGVVVAIQVKVGPGLGIRQAYAVYSFDIVTSMGQTTGAAIAGMICSGYSIDITIGGSFEVAVGLSKAFSPGYSTPRTILFTFPKITAKDPGCPSIP